MIIILFLGMLSLFSNDIDKGAFKFTPYITSYNEYNSNFFASTVDEVNVIMLRILPGIKLENRNNRVTNVQFSLNTSYKYFISLNDSYKDLVGNNSDFDVDGSLNLAFFKTGNFSLYFRDDFSKLSYSGYSNPIQKFVNTFNFGIQTTPFGKALKFRLGYTFGFNKTIFTDNLSSFSKLASEAQDNMSHDFNFDIEWRFLPKTSIISTTSYGFITHYNADSTSASLNVVDSTPIISKLGLLGVITPKLALKLMFGWAYVMYDSGTNFNSLVTNIELTYNFSKKTNLIIGFENSFKDVLFSNYLSYYNFYLNTDISLTNTLTLGFNFNSTLNSYTGVSMGNMVTSSDSRFEIEGKFSTFLSYNFNNKYKAELKYTGKKIFTDFTTTYNGILAEYNYLQHIVALNFFIFF
jgi:hypothetical protein